MKKSLIVIIAAGALASCGTGPEATIEGTAAGIAEGTKVYLLDNARTRVDSTTLRDGKFSFAIARAYPDQAYVNFGGRERFEFVVEPGKITATLGVDPWTERFTGTPTNDAIGAINESVAPLDRKLEQLSEQLHATAEGTPAYDALMADYDSTQQQIDRIVKDAAMRNPASLLTAYMAGSTSYALTTPAEVDSVLTLTGGAPANAFTDRLRERRELLARTAVGVEAPDFTQAQPDGTPLALSSLRGKLVLIDFWASWCGPCRAENPNVVKLYDRFKDSGFEILGVSLDDNRDKWLEAIANDGLAWRHVSDLGGWANAVAKQYAVRSIPHTVLVGPDGVIIAKNLRGEALQAKVAEILTGEKTEFPTTATVR